MALLTKIRGIVQMVRPELPLTVHKREQARINAELAKAGSQLANDGEKLARAKQIIDLAIELAENCAASYREGKPEVGHMWNRAFFDTIRVRDGAVPDSTYEKPFASLFGPHEGSMVEVAGIEPASPGDRLGLLRAQPAVGSRLRASRRRRARRPARFGVRRRPPGGAAAASLLGDARTRVAGGPGRTAA